MIKAIVFDFDGVIVESVDIKTKAFGKLFEPEGSAVVNSVVDYHLMHTGVSRFDKFRYIYDAILKRPLPKDEYDGLCRRFSELVTREVISAPYVSGAKEFLDAYSGAFKLFVASATPQAELEGIITRRRMGSYFSGVYGSPTRKSDAVRSVIERYHFVPDEILFVGDALSDYDAAISNHCHFIARINDNEAIFDGIVCSKISDMTALKAEIDRLTR